MDSRRIQRRRELLNTVLGLRLFPRRFAGDGAVESGLSLRADRQRYDYCGRLNHTKMLLIFFLDSDNQQATSTFATEAMFILASIIHLDKSGLSKTAIIEDFDR